MDPSFFYFFASGISIFVLLFVILRSFKRDNSTHNEIDLASVVLGDQLQAGKYVMERERELVTTEVKQVKQELQRVLGSVEELRRERIQQNQHFATTLDHAFSVSSDLAKNTEQISQALNSSSARGQWGERMAEDVLNIAGFVEGINYRKQHSLRDGKRPDYVFMLPNKTILFMDVKFPFSNYTNYLKSESDVDRKLYIKQFKHDVHQRISELSERKYSDDNQSLSYVLLFVPNESVFSFMHLHDADLINYAIERNVVLCSPTTLFAVLSVIRQAIDNFMIDQKTQDIISSVLSIRTEWENLEEAVLKIGKSLQTVQNSYDQLVGPKMRKFSKQLDVFSNDIKGSNE